MRVWAKEYCPWSRAPRGSSSVGPPPKPPAKCSTANSSSPWSREPWGSSSVGPPPKTPAHCAAANSSSLRSVCVCARAIHASVRESARDREIARAWAPGNGAWRLGQRQREGECVRAVAPYIHNFCRIVGFILWRTCVQAVAAYIQNFCSVDEIILWEVLLDIPLKRVGVCGETPIDCSVET